MDIKSIYRKIVNIRIRGIIGKIRIKAKIVQELMKRNIAYPIEHYYSPYPSMQDIKNTDFAALSSSTLILNWGGGDTRN
jgi:hypothetical protein